SALMLAVRHDSPDVVKLLLQRRVNADLLDVHGQSAERYACSNGFKQSALMLAVFHDSPDIVKLLLEKHVNTNLLDLHGWFAGRYACYYGFEHISPKHHVDDSRPPSDGDLDLAPKKVRHPRFAKLIQAWGEPVINTEAKDGVLKPGTSTFFEDNNSNNENEDAVTTFSQPSSKVPGFSHPAFPAPAPLTSSAVLGVTESISEIELPNCIDHLSGAAGRGEKNTLNGQIESSSDWDSTSLHLNNKAGQRAEHLKVDKCPLVSQSVTTNQSAPTELRQMALVVKKQMNIGAVFLSENAALRGLRQSQLPEKRSSKEGNKAAQRASHTDPDFQRAAEEEQERLDGSENNLSQKCRHPRSQANSCLGRPHEKHRGKTMVFWKPGTSTFFEDNNSKMKMKMRCRTFSQTIHRISGFSHPAFPAPAPLTSSASLVFTEDGVS
ncbi:Coiled-coil domain-containing protein 144A, partial [Camelus dromedarius]